MWRVEYDLSSNSRVVSNGHRSPLRDDMNLRRRMSASNCASLDKDKRNVRLFPKLVKETTVPKIQASGHIQCRGLRRTRRREGMCDSTSAVVG